MTQRSAAGIKSDITGMRARRVTYARHGLSQSFSHYASQLDQIIRVKLDKKNIPLTKKTTSHWENNTTTYAE